MRRGEGFLSEDFRGRWGVKHLGPILIWNQESTWSDSSWVLSVQIRPEMLKSMTRSQMMIVRILLMQTSIDHKMNGEERDSKWIPQNKRESSHENVQSVHSFSWSPFHDYNMTIIIMLPCDVNMMKMKVQKKKWCLSEKNRRNGNR